MPRRRRAGERRRECPRLRLMPRTACLKVGRRQPGRKFAAGSRSPGPANRARWTGMDFGPFCPIPPKNMKEIPYSPKRRHTRYTNALRQLKKTVRFSIAVEPVSARAGLADMGLTGARVRRAIIGVRRQASGVRRQASGVGRRASGPPCICCRPCSLRPDSARPRPAMDAIAWIPLPLVPSQSVRTLTGLAFGGRVTARTDGRSAFRFLKTPLTVSFSRSLRGE